MLGINSELAALTWHVGEPATSVRAHAHSVRSVQADGPELAYIRDRFTNLPQIKPAAPGVRGICTWYGEHAKFIVGNLD